VVKRSLQRASHKHPVHAIRIEAVLVPQSTPVLVLLGYHIAHDHQQSGAHHVRNEQILAEHVAPRDLSPSQQYETKRSTLRFPLAMGKTKSVLLVSHTMASHPAQSRKISAGIVGAMDSETVALAQATSAKHRSQPLQFATTVVPCVFDLRYERPDCFDVKQAADWGWHFFD